MSDMIGLGRRVSKDPNDHKFLLPKRSAEAAEITRRHWSSLGVLDQGGTSECVAHAGWKYLTASPIINRPKFSPHELYGWCQKEDEWPGEDYDGTSVRGLFKVFKRLGFVGEYRWAFDAETVINHVLLTGPVVMGTEWTDDMANVDRHGYIDYQGGSGDMGHSWLLSGADRKRRNPDGTIGSGRLLNSWGLGWGPQRGRAWITFDDLDKLIKADGEAAVGTEIKR